MSKAQAFFDVLGSMARRVVPSSEEAIVRNILAQRPAIERAVEGFTLDPRTGRMLEVGKDFGYSMATVPENPALNRMAGSVVTNAMGEKSVPITEAALEALIRDPYFMDELRRGANFGGWFDESTGEFVLDPSRRFLNKDRSIVLGSRAGQKAGFDLGNSSQYDLTPDIIAEAARQEALRKLRRAFGGAAAGFTAADLLSRRD